MIKQLQNFEFLEFKEANRNEMEHLLK